MLNGVQWDNVGVPYIVSQVKCYGKHMVNKIIADYLKAGKRIVIPQFGAFLHRDTDGGVVFVSFLRKDDGVLAGQLSATYGLSSEEAYGVIAEYVSQIKKVLRNVVALLWKV